MQLLNGNQVKGLIKIKTVYFMLIYLFCLLYWLQDKRDAIPFKESTQVQRENTKTKQNIKDRQADMVCYYNVIREEQESDCLRRTN